MGGRVFPIVVLALGLSQAGCYILPFATPPMQTSIGGGVRVGAPREPTQGPGTFQFDIGLRPLGLVPTPAYKKRLADAGIGYVVVTNGGPTLHGVYLDGAIFPYQGEIARLGVHLQPRLHFVGDTGHAAFGMATRIDIEARGFADSDFSSSSSSGGGVGHAYGEGGIGFFMEGGYARFDERHTFTMTAGLSVRIPATVGIAWGVIKK